MELSILAMNRKPLSPLGIAIQRELDGRKWSAAELARRAKVTPSNLNKYMRGKQAPGIKTLDRIADALDTTPADLLGGVTPPRDVAALEEMLRNRDKEIAALTAERIENHATIRELKEKAAQLKQDQAADSIPPGVLDRVARLSAAHRDADTLKVLEAQLDGLLQAAGPEPGETAPRAKRKPS